jgi:CPA2 family monovalent cation:H+ antiporter-2
MQTLPTILMLLGASVVSVIVFRLANLPPVLGYLLVGTLIGPRALNLVGDFAGACNISPNSASSS